MWNYFYFYGILFTLISFGFFIHERVNSSVYDNAIKQVFKFIFSLSTGWLLVILVLSINNTNVPYNVITEIIYFTAFYIFPITFFVGFEMLLYGLFKEE